MLYAISWKEYLYKRTKGKTWWWTMMFLQLHSMIRRTSSFIFNKIGDFNSSWRRYLSYRNQVIDCRASQWPGFYIIGTSVMKKLREEWWQLSLTRITDSAYTLPYFWLKQLYCIRLTKALCQRVKGTLMQIWKSPYMF